MNRNSCLGIIVIVLIFGCGGDHKSDNNIIKIASFNIQVFGPSKAAETDVMNTLAQIVAAFDIIAIQEIRDSSGKAIDALETAVDALGIDYSYVIGPRLGRTSSKEQYAYMYKADTVNVTSTYTYIDTADDFHREPFIVHFLYANHHFAIASIHTDPDEATYEINKLPDVFTYIQDTFSTTGNIMMVGDYNADCRYFNEDDMTVLLRDNKYHWIIENNVDTNIATSSCTYDRIVTTNIDQSEIDSSGVYLFDELHGLTPEEAKAVSDHYPVWVALKL